MLGLVLMEEFYCAAEQAAGIVLSRADDPDHGARVPVLAAEAMGIQPTTARRPAAEPFMVSPWREAA